MESNMKDIGKKLIKVSSKWTGVYLRVALGVMILPHGSQKLLGWFGGYGFQGTMKFFTESMNIPWVFALSVILIEFFGGIALLLGIGTRVFAFLTGIVMFVALLLVHAQHGFFMNWFGNQKGEGIEFFILAIGISIALVIEGSGKLSIDSLFSKLLDKSNQNEAK